MTSGGYGRKLVHGAAFNLLGGIWGSLLTLVSMPYIVHKMGADSFGLMTVILIVTGYFTFLDFGMGMAVIKHLSERPVGQHGSDRDNRIVFTALATNTLAGAFGAAAIFFSAEIITSWLKLPHEDIAVAISAFHICSLVFFINMFSAVFLAIPQGFQRFDLVVLTRAISQTVQTAGMAALLFFGGSLISIMWLLVAAAAASCLMLIAVSKKLMPSLSPVSIFDADSFRKLFSFGFYSTVTKIAGLLTLQLDRFLIGAMMAVRWVSYYTAASALSGWIFRIASMGGSVILPAASELSSFGDEERLRNLLTRATRLSLVLCLPLAVPMIALPENVMAAWMGSDFAVRGAATLVLLTIGNCLQGAAAAPGMILMGIGMAKRASAISVISGVVIAVLCWLLIPRMGIAGAATAYAASMAAYAVPLFAVCCAKTGCGTIELLNNGLARPVAAGAMNFLVLVIAKPYASGKPGLFAAAIAGGLVYTGFLFVFKAIDSKDIAIAKSFIKRG